MPDDDVLADRYLLADAALSNAVMNWYEVSNWAVNEAARCRHNLAYWTGGDWWGIGPGAHSHVGGVRWWNVKHPAAYAAALAGGRSPGQARELLGPQSRRMEQILLELRLADGISTDLLTPAGRAAAAEFATDGLLDEARLRGGRAVLTLSGRMLADGIALKLTD
jgi:oxygen-independent coproporphyrinogen-3 oxidase